MRDLAELQHKIAVLITDLPPIQQANIMQVVALSYRAGYSACQQETRNAERAIASTFVN